MLRRDVRFLDHFIHCALYVWHWSYSTFFIEHTGCTSVSMADFGDVCRHELKLFTRCPVSEPQHLLVNTSIHISFLVRRLPSSSLRRTQNPARPLSNQHSEPLQFAKPSPYPPFLPVTPFLLGCHLSLLKPAIFPLSKTRKRTPCLSPLSSPLCRLYSSVFFVPTSQP